MYKLNKLSFGQAEPSSVTRLSDNACIPFDLANSDYQQFLKDIKESVELLDADSVAMSAEQVDNLVKSLP